MITQTLQPATIQTNWPDEFRAYLQTEHRKATRRQLSDESIIIAAQHVRVFAFWYQAKFNQAFEPANLTNYDLHVYRKFSLDEERVKASTWNLRHWALSLLCQWRGDLSLMDGVEQKKHQGPSERHRSLTEDERHRLIHTLELQAGAKQSSNREYRAVTLHEHFTAVRNWAIVSLMLQAGLRVEEVSLLAVGDISIHERSGMVLVRDGKGDKQRKVPLNLHARRALASYLGLVCSSKDAFSLGESGEAEGGAKGVRPLFGISIRTIQRIVVELGARIGVADLTCHWLRYTFAKMLEKAGRPIEAIRDLLGHNSIETTRRYLRSSFEELQSAVEVE